MSTLDLFSLKGKKGFITGAARGNVLRMHLQKWAPLSPLST